ncbi:putative alpha-N-acetylglucosaminidase [Polyplosphaeria fusca]|uniref:Alpha-N-acetylglucosaminidase n=1 Tax=Polyplosphaeria fusca TaxID=682080 RepID=A0A9P4QXC4_9PLEO|nr:putative alpha-N-acetylglucosaminidase [Polyplosphaeria fusca]
MRFGIFWIGLALGWETISAATSVQGLYDLLDRRIPGHKDDFTFVLNETARPANASSRPNDGFTVASSNGTIVISGNSISALATGLRRYFTDVAHTDIYWFVGSRLDAASASLPQPDGTITGRSVVPWRYFFNTVTFSYTTAFWSWADWELELDWLALHGVNLPLAWVGFEKILLDVFSDIGLSNSETISFFSGPAFQAWNRFGNIQGSWNGDLPQQWIDDQFELQKKILGRMQQLGMTPILPAFTGFVPRALPERFPNATVVNGSRWNDFQPKYTNTTFLEPSDPLFAELQEKVIKKQIEYYGDVTDFYTLDQYNENDPFSGDLDYLRNVTRGTWQSLKNADADAIWVMQGWLFYSNSDFWSNERVEAYLSGVESDSDMLVLDLFSESQPQWQRTNSYYGKPWVWCELHNYGGNMGLYGQVENLTVNPIEALANSSSLVGFGLTPEGQEGNEIAYALLLDQAWSSTPINTTQYFRSWAENRYAGNNSIPPTLLTAWNTLLTSAYNNTNLKSNAVSKSIFELAPNITGLVNRTGHHPTTVSYPPSLVASALKNMYDASTTDPLLWQNPSFTHDVVDIARQVFSNTFLTSYTTFLSTWNTSSPNTTLLASQATDLENLLASLDELLSALPQFSLGPWIASARAWAGNDSAVADFYEYNARNQISMWGPQGEINDYASKQWAGLVEEYYLKRWRVFLDYVVSTTPEAYDAQFARERVRVVESEFQVQGAGELRVLRGGDTVKHTMDHFG